MDLIIRTVINCLRLEKQYESAYPVYSTAPYPRFRVSRTGRRVYLSTDFGQMPVQQVFPATYDTTTAAELVEDYLYRWLVKWGNGPDHWPAILN